MKPVPDVWWSGNYTTGEFREMALHSSRLARKIPVGGEGWYGTSWAIFASCPNLENCIQQKNATHVEGKSSRGVGPAVGPVQSGIQGEQPR